MNRSQLIENDCGPIRIGISSCLLGNAVRYDGGHKGDRLLMDWPAEFVEWVSVCPEVEAGMGVPRPPLHLVREERGVRSVEIGSGRDHTAAVERYSARRARSLRTLELGGFILKRASPSYGLERIEIHRAIGEPERSGRGIFAAAQVDACPLLPIEEEVRLADARLRENFIERVVAYRRLRSLFRERWTQARLVDFHTENQLQIMAHSPSAHRELSRLVADVEGVPRDEFRDRYQEGFMTALSRMPTLGRKADV
jgi:uncharacterized protein YbbK (DUF523 family)